MRRLSLLAVCVAVCCLLMTAACRDKDRDNSTSSILSLNVAQESNGELVIILVADPVEIIIDTTDPGTPTDPGTGKFLGQTSIQATLKDLEGNPLVGTEVVFSSDAGTLASGGSPVLTDTQGIATDTLTVLEDDPDTITVTATVDTMSVNVEVTKTLILPNDPPTADAGMDQMLECASPGGTPVMLDGSGSSDPDSTPGTNDDIVTFEWWVDGMVIAEGEMVQVTLPLGTTTVTLRVTDSEDQTDEDDVIIMIVDTTPPTLTVIPSPDTLWAPNHKLRNVHVNADVTDTCSTTFQVWLVDVTSDEPDNGTGDGDTENDIQDVEPGTEDYNIKLRAERAGPGDGRTYTLIYRATDESGNQAESEAYVQVPHDQGH